MRIHFNQVSNTILDVKIDKRTECFNFGADNAYPSMIEALISMSVTSKLCVDKVAKAIYGGSFGEVGDVVVNSKGQTLNEVYRIASRESAKHNNVYFHIGYDGNLGYKSIVVVPAVQPRLGKADDKGYSGKYIVYDDWAKKRVKKIQPSSFQYVNIFSRNKEIVEGQIEDLAKDSKDFEERGIDGLITEYNGQLKHIKKDDAFIYSLSDLDSVLADALLERNSQTFRSRGAEKGFLNTKILVVPPFKDDPDRKAFIANLRSVKGADNSSEVLLLEMAKPTEDVSKQIFAGDLSSSYNDKLLQYSDSQAEKEICKAFNVPLILVSPSDNSLFGASGALFKEAKKQLFESKEEERNQLVEFLSLIMSGWYEEKDQIKELNVVNPFKEDEEVVEDIEVKTPEELNAEAQATLRGSVGGVTSLLAIQASIATGMTEKDAGVSMIVNIYGFAKEQAEEMIGNPAPKEFMASFRKKLKRKRNE